ncbi:MAG TPA: two-component regulator propeller domain-containing protein [Chitinophagales bacterium]|nr:two-component regulator propeller domain-containing protein [Chitinophagales bacterium]
MRKALLLAALLKVISACAQDDVIFTRYSHFDGLPSAFNNTQLFTDQAGLLWIYSEQGFARYDGYNFKIYPFNNAALWGKKIPTGYVPEYPGGFERFYFSVDLDVYVYNPLKNGFDRYDFSKFISGDTKQTLWTINDSKNHCIWVNSKKNLFRLNYFTGQIKKYDAPPTIKYSHLIPGNQIIYNAWGDSVSVFNIGTEKFRTEYLKNAREIEYFQAEYFSGYGDENKGELISKVILSKDMKTIYWFSAQSSWSPKVIERDSTMGDLLAEHSVMTLTDPYNLWISRGLRLLHIDLRTEKMDSINITVNDSAHGDFHTTGITKDGDNELWISYVNHGLIRVNTSTKKVIQYLSLADNPNSLWSNDIFAIQYHRSGVIWVSQNSYGLVKIEKKRNIFSTIVPVASEFAGLPDYFQSTNTRMCLPLDNDHLLAGTFVTISDINIRTGKADVVRYDDNSIVKELSSSHTWGCAAADRQGNIFVGTWDNWLFVYNPHSKTCHSFYALPGGPPVRKISQTYRAMLIDSRDMLWIGSKEGLFRISVNELLSNPSPQIQAMNANEKNDSSIWKMTFAFLEDRNKNVWAGSMSGINVYSPDGKTTSYIHEEERNSLSTNEVRCFAEDRDGNIWIGTFGGGLNKFDIRTHQFTVYSKQDGLPDDVIYTMLFDNEGNLWLSSNSGLCKFNPSNKVVTNFTPFDGLQGYEFNTNAFCKMPGGELVFGGTAGINVFKPEDIAVSAPVPNVILSSFKVMGEETPLDSDVVRLNYNQDNLAFQFATTSYYRSAENQFAYKLEGLDNDWVYSGNRAYVIYSHIPPGDYTFRVKAANSSGIWNEKGVAYKISVSPPWWATWWFRIAAVLTIASAVYLLYRYQLQQALKLQAIRNRIAGDLHDEIGSTLSSISIYSQVAKKEVINKAPEAAGMLENITDSTTGMMDAMNDIVWMINTKNDRFDNIVDRMNAFANELLEAKNCNVHLQITPELQRLHLDMSQRKNLYLIFKEAINNAAKYADCRNVWIDLSMNGSHKIIMMIHDDGKGFDTNTGSNGNGLYNMKKRAGELNGELHFNSKVGEGTSLKLEFSL